MSGIEAVLVIPMALQDGAVDAFPKGLDIPTDHIQFVASTQCIVELLKVLATTSLAGMAALWALNDSLSF